MIMNILTRISDKLKRMIHGSPKKFDATGERVDIFYSENIDFERLDMYEKSHYKRYEFALKKINAEELCGDFACGTGYGSLMLAAKALKVIGADINERVINAIKKRYKSVKNVQFVQADLLHLSYDQKLDNIISFETIEHFTEQNIFRLLEIFNACLKPEGKLIISTPYKQEKSEAALKLGHHLTFYIDEKLIETWLSSTGFDVLSFQYQNYDTHLIDSEMVKKDFIICVAQKRLCRA